MSYTVLQKQPRIYKNVKRKYTILQLKFLFKIEKFQH